MGLINKVCLDDVCKLVEVTLYWDAIGYYKRLEYPKGKPLTKLEHEPFTPDDYKKLDSILKDRTSILNDHSLGFLATENKDTPRRTTKLADDIDAVTKPHPMQSRKPSSRMPLGLLGYCGSMQTPKLWTSCRG